MRKSSNFVRITVQITLNIKLLTLIWKGVPVNDKFPCGFTRSDELAAGKYQIWENHKLKYDAQVLLFGCHFCHLHRHN